MTSKNCYKKLLAIFFCFLFVLGSVGCKDTTTTTTTPTSNSTSTSTGVSSTATTTGSDTGTTASTPTSTSTTVIGLDGEEILVNTGPNPTDPTGTNVSSTGTTTGATTGTSTGTATEPQNSASLNVPLRNQLDPANGSLANVACGPTSIGMLMSFFGVNIPTATLIPQCRVQANVGCYLDDLLRTVKANGFPNASTKSTSDQNWIKEKLKGGEPVLVFIEGHFMICTGFKENGNLLFNDPWGGKKTEYTPAQFQNVWINWCLVLH